MQVKFYRSVHRSDQKQDRRAMTVRVPGYVSTASWSAPDSPDVPTEHKGRSTTPPPSVYLGLHQLTLEAFWLD